MSVTSIKAEIDANIVPNNNAQLITGAKLNTTLKDMVDESHAELTELETKVDRELGTSTETAVTPTEHYLYYKDSGVYQRTFFGTYSSITPYPVIAGDVILYSGKVNAGTGTQTSYCILGLSSNNWDTAVKTPLLVGDSVFYNNEPIVVPDGISYVVACSRSADAALGVVIKRTTEGEVGERISALEQSVNSIIQTANEGGVVYKQGDKFLGSGASFMTANGTDTGWTPEINGYNRWFEDACNKLGVIPINHAIGGQSIVNTANMMRDANTSQPHGSLFMEGGVDIFNDVSVFVIMHVHNQDVFYTGNKTLADYLANGYSGYAEAYDYVIKQYMKWCVDARKLCQIVLCTHWHDARTIFNSSVRKLANKWGLTLCRFDDKVGFSKTTPLDSGNQISRFHSWDWTGAIVGSLETIDGVLYGWHMEKPTFASIDNYTLSPIQERLSAVFECAIGKK